ncbi:IS4 family transposase [Tatumella ptyseos]|uniref:Insertion element 4 transposase N-terminal n=2 Tax=Tatumella ptyseos TaxID=82987 RepID=A0A2X5SKQ1_9GAMM|nr:IS4 family transposase [Tatumella ptyseos]SQK75964.1 Insertion element 4 transposase N-terminal [Tatumella ptyseos]
MELSQALGMINLTAPDEVQSLADLLPPELIQQAFSLTDTVTLRKRKLPLESMVWLVIGMAIFNNKPLSHIVNLMDIADRSGRSFTAPSSVIARRKKLGEDPVRVLFDLTQQHWHRESRHPLWHGLTLNAVDGVVWRTPDTPENAAAFAKAENQYGEKGYPQVRMVCLMELSSHLLRASVMDRYDVNEMRLAAGLIGKVPDNSVTLFDKGFWSAGLLHEWHSAGENRHWLLPLKKGTQYEVVRRLGKKDELIMLKTSPQARKQWEKLPETLTVRLIRRKVNGVERQVLTSMKDAMRYPAADVAELYKHRWEIELGYREAKQMLCGGRWTLRSKLPGMVRQELWGILLTYNLVRYQMVKMAFSLKGNYLPYQLSFSGSLTEILRLLIGLPWSSPGAIPGHLKHFYSNAAMLKLPPGRERKYEREVRPKKPKYPFKNNAGHLK